MNSLPGGENPDLLRVEFENYRERFIDHLNQLGRSPLTLKNYRSDLDAFMQWIKTFHEKKLNSANVDPLVMKQYQTFLSDRQKLKPNTINRRMRTIRKFYVWLQQLGVYSKGSFPTYVPLEKENLVERSTPITEAEQDALLKAVDKTQNLRDKAMITMLLYAGLRVGELCRLRWSDIEIADNRSRVTIRNIKSLPREITLHPKVCNALLELGYSTKASSQDRVFVGQRGPMTSRGVQEIIKKYGTKVNLGTLSPRILRHTCAVMLLKRDVPLETITKFMGSSVETLRLLYLEQSSEVVEKIE